MDSRGDFGVGSLTIFLAMLLVGAIAAGVLIQTTNAVQQDAQRTGDETKEELVTLLKILEISGRDGSDGTVENITVTLRLAGGSNPVRFGDLLVQLDTDTFSAHFNHRPQLNSTAYCEQNGTALPPEDCAVPASNNGAGHFTHEYINRGRATYDDAVFEGDVIRIHLAANTTIAGGNYFRLYIIPTAGTPDLVEGNAPDVISHAVAQLYP